MSQPGGLLGILMQGNMSKLIHTRCIPCCQIVVLREFVPTVDAPVRIRLSSTPRIGMSVFLAIQVLIHVRDAQHLACCNRLKTHMFAVESTWHFESKIVRFKGSGFPT